MKDLLQSTKTLPNFTKESIIAYTENRQSLLSMVDELVLTDKNIHLLTGGISEIVIKTNHRYHADFITVVLQLNRPDLLASMLPWIYQAYMGRGFDPAYFPLHLSAWMKAIIILVPEAKGILPLYQWMLDSHQQVVTIASEKIAENTQEQTGLWKEFMQKLLEGDTQSSLQLTRKWIQDNKTPEWLYLEILKPAMYEIGRLWQQGLITEAHEHLASSIVTRIMTDIYLDFPKKEKFKGKVLISSAVNEFHELGSWMLSDLLENSGWQVKYLGANVPNQAVIQMVREFQPDYLAISVTMPFNLIHVKTLTEDLEQEFGKNRPQVLAGGYCFNLVEDLWKSVGADGYAENIREGVDLLNHWAKNEN